MLLWRQLFCLATGECLVPMEAESLLAPTWRGSLFQCTIKLGHNFSVPQGSPHPLCWNFPPQPKH